MESRLHVRMVVARLLFRRVTSFFRFHIFLDLLPPPPILSKDRIRAGATTDRAARGLWLYIRMSLRDNDQIGTKQADRPRTKSRTHRRTYRIDAPTPRDLVTTCATYFQVYMLRFYCSIMHFFGRVVCRTLQTYATVAVSLLYFWVRFCRLDSRAR
jgi:hypothetical protein